MTKIFKSTYELEEQILAYIFENSGKLRHTDKKQLKDEYSYTTFDIFTLDDITIERRIHRGKGGGGTTIKVDGVAFTSLYADHYLSQLLDAVINKEPMPKTPVHPPRVLQLEAILKKCR